MMQKYVWVDYRDPEYVVQFVMTPPTPSYYAKHGCLSQGTTEGRNFLI